MFTVEIRINGSMISHIYGRNVSESQTSGKHVYDFEYYQPETRKIQKGQVEHNRSDGINSLISSILDIVE